MMFFCIPAPLHQFHALSFNSTLSDVNSNCSEGKVPAKNRCKLYVERGKGFSDQFPVLLSEPHNREAGRAVFKSHLQLVFLSVDVGQSN